MTNNTQRLVVIASDVMFALAGAINVVNAAVRATRGDWSRAGGHAVGWCIILALWLGLRYARQSFTTQTEYLRAQIAVLEQVELAVRRGEAPIRFGAPPVH